MDKRIREQQLKLRKETDKLKKQQEEIISLKKIKEKDADTVILEKELSLKLGVKLTINDKNNKGNIKIEYRNVGQRENIIKKLTGE